MNYTHYLKGAAIACGIPPEEAAAYTNAPFLVTCPECLAKVS